MLIVITPNLCVVPLTDVRSNRTRAANIALFYGERKKHLFKFQILIIALRMLKYACKIDESTNGIQCIFFS